MSQVLRILRIETLFHDNLQGTELDALPETDEVLVGFFFLENHTVNQRIDGLRFEGSTYKSTFGTANFQDAVRHQGSYRLPYRVPPDTEAGGQLRFSGNLVSRVNLPVDDGFRQSFHHDIGSGFHANGLHKI